MASTHGTADSNFTLSLFNGDQFESPTIPTILDNVTSFTDVTTFNDVTTFTNNVTELNNSSAHTNTSGIGL